MQQLQDSLADLKAQFNAHCVDNDKRHNDKVRTEWLLISYFLLILRPTIYLHLIKWHVITLSNT